MKKHLYLALATTLALASCQKETPEPTPEPQATPITFTAGFAEDTTKTQVNPTTGRVTWVEGEEITITGLQSSSMQTGIYYVSAVDSKRVATLTYRSGTEFTNQTNPVTYTATYGNVNNQLYDSSNIGSNCPMEATVEATVTPKPWTGSITPRTTCAFKFTNSCGVIAITANTGDIKICRITVGQRSLYFKEAQKLTGNETLLLAMPEDEKFKTVCFMQPDGSTASRNLSKDASIKRNTLNTMPVGDYFKDASKYSNSAILPGEFSVSASKKVHFSRGNLQYQASTGTWRFAEHQYDYIGNNYGNITAVAVRATQTYWIDLFGWGATGFNQYNQMPYSTSGEYKTQATAAAGETLTFANKADWGFCFGGENSSWYTLSTAEWKYLIDNRTDASKKRKQNVTVAGKRVCMILAPDNYTGNISDSYSSADWVTAEANGLVCLPASGYRNGITIENAEYKGQYWSSSGNYSNSAYNLSFQSSNLQPQNSAYRSYGYSVRLVYYVK